MAEKTIDYNAMLFDAITRLDVVALALTSDEEDLTGSQQAGMESIIRDAIDLLYKVKGHLMEIECVLVLGQEEPHATA